MSAPQPATADGRLGPPTWIRWQMVVILMGFTGLNHFNRQSIPAVVNQIMDDCRFTATQMGSISSAMLLGYTVFMIAGGWLADRRGAWFSLVLSGFGTAAFVAATGYCNVVAWASATFSSFLVIRCMMGIFSAPLFPAAGRIVTAWIPFENRAWANGLVLGATTVGVSLSPIAFGALSDKVGWPSAFVAMGIVTAMVTCVWYQYGRNKPAEHPFVNDAELALIPREELPTSPRVGPHGLLALLKKPSLIFLTLNYAAVGYFEYMLFYWMKYYFIEVRSYSEETSRYLTTIVTSAMVIAMPLGGILSDRLVRAWGYQAGRMCVPIFGMLSSAGLLVLATKADGIVATTALFYLAHAAIGLCEAPTWVAGLELGGENCATSGAIVNTGGNLGGMLAPVVTAYIAQEYGWNAGFVVASVVCLVGVFQWFGVRLQSPAGSTAA
ncbi:MAG TPA: MFS transporter [Planctomycetaceae bacterium]|nr:MFS transporter [Planctomycetaceae bacterium]